MKISSISTNEYLHHTSARCTGHFYHIEFIQNIYWLKLTHVNYYSWRSSRRTLISHPMNSNHIQWVLQKAAWKSWNTTTYTHRILHEWRKCYLHEFAWQNYIVDSMHCAELQEQNLKIVPIIIINPSTTCLLDNYTKQRGQSWQLECPHASCYITKNFDHRIKINVPEITTEF